MYKMINNTGNKGFYFMTRELNFYMKIRDEREQETPRENKSGLEMNYKEIQHAFFGKKRKRRKRRN